MVNKGILICFTGVDGAGKTTHARSLTEYLKQKGYMCKYIWCGHRPLISYPFFALTRLVGYWKKIKRSAFTDPLECAPERIKKKLARALWLFFFADFQIITFFRVSFSLMLGRYIVCDRYFYDLLMELKRNNVPSRGFFNLISKTLPQPLIVFLMDAQEVLISKRRNLAFEELKAKREIFLQMSKTFSFIVIDSKKKFSYNQEIIRKLVLKAIDLYESRERKWKFF
jgi:dTMP kinase